MVDTEHYFDDEKVISSILYPLRRLRNIDAKIWASVSEEVEEDAIAEMRLADPAFNTVKHCLSTLADAEAYLCLVNFLDPLPSDQRWMTGNSRAAEIAEGAKYLQFQMGCGRPLFRDWSSEVAVQGRLVDLQKHLHDVFPVHIAQQCEYVRGKTTYENWRIRFFLWVDEDEVRTYLDQLKKHLDKAFPDEMRNIVHSFSKLASDGTADQVTNDRRFIMDDPARARFSKPDPARL